MTVNFDQPLPDQIIYFYHKVENYISMIQNVKCLHEKNLFQTGAVILN